MIKNNRVIDYEIKMSNECKTLLPVVVRYYVHLMDLDALGS